jgi:TonB dependent receptor/TonB-dependent Receptor Plug Domain
MKMKMKQLPLAVVQALSISLGVTALTVAIGPVAIAQSNAAGNIYGQATVGSVIIAESIDTGAKRRATADANGRFSINGLPTGPYKVQLLSGDKVVSTRQVEVLIGQGVDASFAAGGTQAIESVQVIARRQTIDVSSSNSGVTFTAKELDKLPVARNVASIIQLAPNTTSGDSRYGGVNAPSFGGASASENAYYINGFPVTNVLFQVGFSQLPFGSIGQAQVLTGGYGAEFGRSTGGVVNITTKSGTNEWEAGISSDWIPAQLRGKAKEIYFANTGGASNAATDNTIRFVQSRDQVSSLRYNAYVGGPIIKDKLFFYVNAETTRQYNELVNTASNAGSPVGVTANAFQVITTNTPRYLAKLDWNITDNHHLEYTQIRDQVNQDRKFYGFDYRTQTQTPVQAGGISYVNSGPTPVAAASGADLKIAKYTGFFTENIKFEALYGQSETPHATTPFGFNPSLFQTISTPADRLPGVVYNNPQTAANGSSILVPGAEDKQKAFRLDLEWKLGKHTARVGIDNNKTNSVAGTSLAGGGQWLYGNSGGNSSTLPPGATISPAASGTVSGAQGLYVQRIFSDTATKPSVEQSAQFIEDRWQFTNNLLLTLGLRNEQFSNFNGDKVVYVEQRKQLAPRLAAAWDANGDGSLKVYGTLGRYHLQLPSNVAVRGAGSSLNTNQYFGYNGVDPVTGAPTGLVPLSPVLSANNEFGQAKDPRQVAAVDLKAHYQDEMTLGFDKAWSPSINFGSKATYRALRSTIDDFCDQRPFDAWAARNNVNASNFAFQCALFNPGSDNRFTIDIDGDGKLENISLSAKDLGYPKVKRTYTAFDFYLEHPFRNGWYGKINYTWSASKGNTEGQTLSDIGQADVATTQAFDFPEITLNSYGRLPNDRRHQFKAYGFYAVTPEWIAGANGLLASGRPKNCLGSLPDNLQTSASTNPQDYGSAFFFCSQAPALGAFGTNNGAATPRGSQGTLPWISRLDLNLTYNPVAVKGLSLKATVFNVFNKQVVTTIEERRNLTSGAVRNTSQSVLAYTAPISFQFTVSYDFKP